MKGIEFEKHSVEGEALWTANQVASFMKCSVSYVYKATERGALPCVRIGRMVRFRPEVVRAFTFHAPMREATQP